MIHDIEIHTMDDLFRMVSEQEYREDLGRNRDLFVYRAAFRCTTPNTSNIVLGHGWAEQGYTATDIAPTNQGAAYLIAEGGTPKRIKVAYLSDAQIAGIADYAAWIRRPRRLPALIPDLTRVDFEVAA